MKKRDCVILYSKSSALSLVEVNEVAMPIWVYWFLRLKEAVGNDPRVFLDRSCKSYA